MDAVVATILPVHQGGTLMSRPLFHRATLGHRLGAHLLDRFFFYGSLIVIGVSAAASESTDITNVSWFVVVLAFVITPGYLLWFCYAAARGTTPGKRITGLKMITSEGHKVGFCVVIVRETLGKLVSSLFGIGFLWALFDNYDRALHDIIFDTHVVEAAKYNTSVEQQDDE